MRKLLFLFLSLLTASIANAQNCDKLIVTERNTYPADNYIISSTYLRSVSELQESDGIRYSYWPLDTIRSRKKGEREITEQTQKNKSIAYAENKPIKAEIFAVKFSDSIFLELRVRDTITSAILTHLGNKYERIQFLFGHISYDVAVRKTKYNDGIRISFAVDETGKFAEMFLGSSSSPADVRLEKIVWYTETLEAESMKRMEKKKETKRYTIVIGQFHEELLTLTITKPEAEKLRQALICLTR